MLRSLSYQLLEYDPHIVEFLASATATIPTWTEKAARAAFFRCLQATKQKVCIFIDGLDEFTGDENQLLEECIRCSSLPNVKFCISSRPERSLKRQLRRFPQLRLQDLTRNDMESYVHGKLGFEGLENVRACVVTRTQGIFLWTSLVTDTLLKGYHNHDGEKILLQRSEVIPRGLEELYMYMLDSTDSLYAEKARCYFLLVRVFIEEAKQLRYRYLTVRTLALATDPRLTK